MSDTGVAEQTVTRVGHCPMYKVLLHDDPKILMDTVVKALQVVFRYDIMKALKIMTTVHETGIGLCKIEPLEPAELHKDQLETYKLTVTLERA